jgi:hypothetical protein
LVFNVTFNNISVIIMAVSFIGEENLSTMRKSPTCQTDKLNHIMLYRVHIAWAGFELTTSVVIGTGCIANYHTITTTTAPFLKSKTLLVHIILYLKHLLRIIVVLWW